jgi:group II intron reverse transcriptase/maturase
MIDYYETKTNPITKKMVLEAYKKVRENGGSAGVDEQDLGSYSKNLQRNLYKLWNRMTSGSYYPSCVKEVKIPKKSGGYRSLGIPTVEDRIAQQVVKSYLEPKVDETFHPDSFGYRPGKSAHDALELADKRCREFRWVLDLDIKGFFDNLDHDLLIKGLEYYTKERWVIMYVKRWLKAGILSSDKVLLNRTAGTPQGGVISPLLANIYLHITFDKWIERYYPHIRFERYCDDIIIHCTSRVQANYIKKVITQRFRDCKLELNESKTHIVYCKSQFRTERHKEVSFDFLGYTFRPRLWTTRQGVKLFFTPCMSQRAKKAVRDKIRSLALYRFQVPIQELAKTLNPKLRGWINYYCKFNKWSTSSLWKWVNLRIAKWLKENRGFAIKRAFNWLKGVFKTQPGLFAHWQLARP